jgi:hypothetical protein
LVAPKVPAKQETPVTKRKAFTRIELLVVIGIGTGND